MQLHCILVKFRVFDQAIIKTEIGVPSIFTIPDYCVDKCHLAFDICGASSVTHSYITVAVLITTR